MNLLAETLLLGLCITASFLYSGAEIGFYSLSRVQVELEAGHGSRAAKRVQRLLRDESALLITLLIGNNLVLQLATRLRERIADSSSLGEGARVLAVGAILTPLVFLFGEALPKETFRRRPHHMTYASSAFVLASRILYWPLERVLRGLTAVLERAFGIGRGRVSTARGRERLSAYLEEGLRHGALSPRAEVLARNALLLRSIPISRAMVPWSGVLRLRRGTDPATLYETVRSSRWTRIPVVDEAGHFLGYVHQLDVLSAGPLVPVLDGLRAMPVLPADTPVDRALLRLRGTGQRAAIVGTAQRPQGLVTLKDLVEEISGDLVGL